ncbi:hypothetical protein GON09_002504 [Rhodococcus sp. B50]|nr:hypothetical protein [Rhodococcus sp. B50]
MCCAPSRKVGAQPRSRVIELPPGGAVQAEFLMGTEEKWAFAARRGFRIACR